MKLKALIIGSALCAGSLFANSVTIWHTNFDGNPNQGGGEFLAVSSNNGSFLTFCLEESVSVNSFQGVPYAYTIDNTVLNQGLLNTSDNVSKGTAWLYKQFRNGTLNGPTSGAGSNGTYNGSTTGRHDVDAGLLQDAIWMLEDESIAYDASNFYIVQAIGHFGSLANAKADNGITSVKVMNLWTTVDSFGQPKKDKFGNYIGDKQSQLVLVPDTGMTVVLFSLGLLSLAVFRRKL